MSDDLMPDPESLRYLDRLRRNPDLWTVAVVRSSTPLAEHGDPDACPCLAHHAARLVHARPDPALDPDQPKEAPMPRTAKTKPGQRRKPPRNPEAGAEQRPPRPCVACGISVEQGSMSMMPRRRCEECAGRSDGDLIAAALARCGVEADPASPEVQAAAVAWMHSPPSDVPRNGIDPDTGQPPLPRPANPEPWSHLDPKHVRREVAIAKAALRPRAHEPHPSGGGCDGCSINTSASWADYSTRRDRLILCDRCADLYDRAGGDRDGFANALTADLLDVRATMGLAEWCGFLPAHEVGAAPSPERFGYISREVVTETQAAYWSARPASAPPEVRDRQARVAAARAKVARPSAPPPPLVAPRRGHLTVS